MVQTPVRFKKGIAIELRKKGLSYSDIQNSINLPRSTIAYWLKDIELSEEQKEKLKAKRSQVAKSNSEKRIFRISREIEDIKKLSAKEIGGITKRELWLMGIILYWKEKSFGNENDLRKGINFSSSDPDQIKLFLKWIQEIGKIEDEEVIFDIFINKNEKDSLDKIKNYWSSVTGFSRGHFSRVYLYRTLKSSDKKIERRRTKKSEFGLLRIRIKASSMLARQIAGWIGGIRERISR